MCIRDSPITASQAQNIVEQACYTNCVYYKVNPNNNTAYKDGRDSEALYFTAVSYTHLLFFVTM